MNEKIGPFLLGVAAAVIVGLAYIKVDPFGSASTFFKVWLQTNF